MEAKCRIEKILDPLTSGFSCSKGFINILSQHYRVHMGPGKPGKSWNFNVAFSRTGKSWKRATGPGKFWKSVKLK